MIKRTGGLWGSKQHVSQKVIYLCLNTKSLNSDKMLSEGEIIIILRLKATLNNLFILIFAVLGTTELSAPFPVKFNFVILPTNNSLTWLIFPAKQLWSQLRFAFLKQQYSMLKTGLVLTGFHSCLLWWYFSLAVNCVYIYITFFISSFYNWALLNVITFPSHTGQESS